MAIFLFWIGLRSPVFEFKYDKWAINKASKNTHITVVDWFNNSG